MNRSENVVSFNEGWSFLETELSVELLQAEGMRDQFQRVELPHDWLIYDTRNLYRDGCGWYRKEFEAEEREHLIVRFDGIYMDSTVYLNGRKLCDWKYGYSTFDVDLSPALCGGKNRLMVQVRFQAPNSRWYSGAGIYRNVWLKRCEKAYLPLDGTYVHICKEGQGFRLTARTEAAGEISDGTFMRFTLWKDQGMVYRLGDAYIGDADSADRDAASCGIPYIKEASVSALIKDPELWDIDDPQVYELKVELMDPAGKRCLDVQSVTVGFRTFEFTPDHGFFLNGRSVKIHGMCEHHDLGCLGAAFHTQAMERKLRILKEMGCNAIRISHNMPAPEVMELADRMGLLVLDEAFDMWERCKTPYDYGRFFKEWHKKDICSFVRRDRNHPSLLMWSVGNEIYDTHADEHGQDITRELAACVREYDPEGNAPITICSNYMAWENARKCADIVKFAGYNYGEKYYEEQHREHPDWIMYGSETASFVESRGVYRFPLEQSVLSDEDGQCSALGNSTTSWGARSWEKCIADDRDAEYILGQFVWSGFDYIGEPTPYHTKNSYFGKLDTAGFAKDSYYFFQAEWTEFEKAPMVHLFPFWDFNEGQIIDVRACSNAASVELFLNGKSLGRRTLDHLHGKELLADWKVPYEKGTITAVAYGSDGKEAARDSHTSFGDSRKIVLCADRPTDFAQSVGKEEKELYFVTVSTVDQEGNPVENASDYVKAKVMGPGRILGMDNGDSTDYDSYKTNVRKLFSGKLLIVVQRTGKGKMELCVTGRGLESARMELKTERDPDTAACMKKMITQEKGPDGQEKAYMGAGEAELCAMRDFPERIPIRKLELCALDGQRADAQKRELTVEARLYPEDTTDRELVWKIVNAAGIDIGIAKISGEDNSGKMQGNRVRARITAMSDGDFYVRCMAKDGESVRLISQLEFTAEGIGTTFLDPYGFISAGLYSETIGDITNGNEKGIATARDGKSGVVYGNIDFGEFGSDILTLPVFALSDDDYPIEFWLGAPGGKDARLLETLHYQKTSQWNVYQEETYKLPERIRGVAEIGFMMHAKVHLKGFSFRKLEKAYEMLSGSDADRVYGDSFTRQGNDIKGIGNNVTIEYGGMDFGEKGAGAVTVCGFTPLAVNTIHLHFTKENGDMEQRILEFAGTEEPKQAEQSFQIEPFRGKGKLELIFLPGSSFDFSYIKFGRSSEMP